MKIIKTLTYPSRLSEFLISKLITNELNKRSRAHLLANPLPVAIFAQDFIGNEIQTMGFYEKKHLECLFEFLHPLSDEFKNGYALDIGANIGNHTLFFQNRFKHVISFEPSPLIFKLLKFNVTPFSNVTVHNFALGENYSQSLLHLKNSNLGSSTLIHDRQEFDSTASIEIRSLDALKIELQPLMFMKIDVEGFEQFVILGALETIGTQQPVIVFEQWPEDFINSASHPINLLRDIGYRFAWQKNNLPSKTKWIKLFMKGIQMLRGHESIEFVTSDFVPVGHYSMLIAVPPRYFRKLNFLS